MITATTLKSPRYLAALKAAAVQAVRQSHARVVPAAAVWVKNRRGEAAVYVQACRGRAIQFYDVEGRNITETVLAALQVWHFERRYAS
jgi:phosphoribosylanthranilate isomerase